MIGVTAIQLAVSMALTLSSASTTRQTRLTLNRHQLLKAVYNAYGLEMFCIRHSPAILSILRESLNDMLHRLTPLAWASLLSVAMMFWPTASANALPLTTMAAIPGLSSLFAGTQPDLGVQDGQLSPCPDSPNCVVSQNADADHAIAPLSYQTDRDTARDIVLKVLTVVPRTQVVEQTDSYIRFASSSRLLGFVDDGEFYFPEDEAVIHIRSASRLGESDLEVNRRRIEQIRLALQDLGV